MYVRDELGGFPGCAYSLLLSVSLFSPIGGGDQQVLVTAFSLLDLIPSHRRPLHGLKKWQTVLVILLDFAACGNSKVLRLRATGVYTCKWHARMSQTRMRVPYDDAYSLWWLIFACEAFLLRCPLDSEQSFLYWASSSSLARTLLYILFPLRYFIPGDLVFGSPRLPMGAM